MAKNRKPAKHVEYQKAMRRAQREQYVADLSEGRRQRAVTFTDRKKQADRGACRGRVDY